MGQRVIELQDRLIEAERNRVLTQAAGAAAHEINQPLTVLIGMAELLLYQMDEESTQRDNVKALHESARRIADIVKKMLYLDWKFTLGDNDLKKVNNILKIINSI